MTDKYKLFKNYMHNELGITKHDIHDWVRETIREEIQAIHKNMDLKSIIKQQSATLVKENDYYVKKYVADKLVERIKLELNDGE